jgi:hypothetical protein
MWNSCPNFYSVENETVFGEEKMDTNENYGYWKSIADEVQLPYLNCYHLNRVDPCFMAVLRSWRC